MEGGHENTAKALVKKGADIGIVDEVSVTLEQCIIHTGASRMITCTAWVQFVSHGSVSWQD